MARRVPDQSSPWNPPQGDRMLVYVLIVVVLVLAGVYLFKRI
jgi:hypothetical protein